MKDSRLPIVHKLKFTSKEIIDEVNNPKEWPVKIPRPVSIGEDVQKGDKILFLPQSIVRTVKQVTDQYLFLKK